MPASAHARLRATVLAALLACVVLPQAAAAGGWRAPVQISDDGATVYGPQVVSAPDGSTTVIWYQQDGSDWRMTAATRLAGETTWSDPEPISADGTNVSRNDYRIAAAGDGSVAVTWLTNPQTHIEAAVRPAGSATFGPAEQLDGAGNIGDRDIVGRPDGTFVAVWGDYSAAMRSRVFDGGWGPELVVDDDGGGDDTFQAFALDADDTGDVTAVYSRRHQQPDAATVTSARLGSAAADWDPPQTVEDLAYGSFNIDVAAAPNGEVTAVYDLDETGGDGPDTLRANTRSASGGWGTPVSITQPGERVWVSQVVADEDSNVTVTVMKLNAPEAGALMANFSADRPAAGSWTGLALMSPYGAVSAYGKVFPTISGTTNALWSYSPDMTVFGAGHATRPTFGAAFSAPTEIVSNASFDVGPASIDGNRFGDLAFAWNDAGPGNPVYAADLTGDRSARPPAGEPPASAPEQTAPEPAPTPAPAPAPHLLALRPAFDLVLKGKTLTVNARVALRASARCSGTVRGRTRVGGSTYRATLRLVRTTIAGRSACVAKGTIKLRKAPARSAAVKLSIDGRQIAARAVLAKRT
ncbi:MAG: hypothetical protein V9E83_11210 [Baekduia sp.]